jgi:beta-glucosidase
VPSGRAKFAAMKPLLLGLSVVILGAAPVRAAGTTVPFSGDVDARASALLAQMTPEEKIGQMIQADYSALAGHEEDITRLALGSVLNGGSSDPGDNSPRAWADAIDACERRALATRLKIPLLYGIDAVHGHNNIPGAVIFPHNLGLGATRDAALVERAARVTAEEVVATGANWTFSPGVIVARDERWGRTYESFGEQPDLVGRLGAGAIRGYQTADLASPTSILACAKHFLGDGGTTGGKDQGDTVCDEPTLRRLFLAPYVDAVRAGVGSIMVSYSSWNGGKMHGQARLLTDVLKGELGFRGFLVSDWAAIDQLPGDYATEIATAINAGLDMIMIPNGPGKRKNYVEFATLLGEHVRAGRVNEARIDDAVRRILRVKLAMGLADRPLVGRSRLGALGSPEHRAVARECVQRSLVLLKNDRGAFPFSKSLRNLHVVGAAADDLGAQCGGWTISWQGGHGAVTPGGTTLLAGLRQVAPAGCTVTFDAEAANLAGADAVVAIIAEDPYAEGRGDRKDLALPEKDLALLRRARAANVPVVLVLLSGRPLILGEALGLCDALVAAWLPGTEGAGVADVLFGAKAPTGKLPMSWPRTMAQIPVNMGDAAYDPLFPYGFGLDR